MPKELQLPQPPDLFPEKLKRIDPEGCEQQRRGFLEWWRKVTNQLRGKELKLPDPPVLFTDAAKQSEFVAWWGKVAEKLKE